MGHAARPGSQDGRAGDGGRQAGGALRADPQRREGATETPHASADLQNVRGLRHGKPHRPGQGERARGRRGRLTRPSRPLQRPR
eukprot:3073114-Pyramimonas_sp.AAC.1